MGYCYQYWHMLSIIVLLVVFVLIAIRRMGNIRLQIWQIMSLGAIAVLVSGQISPLDALKAVNLDVMFFLFGMFIVGEALPTSVGVRPPGHRDSTAGSPGKSGADKTLSGVPHGAAAYRKGIPQAVFPSLVCRDRTDVHKNSRSSPDGNADQYLPICHHGQIASRWDSESNSSAFLRP